MGADRQAEADRALDRAAVEHRQHAGQGDVHRARLAVGLGAEGGAGAGKILLAVLSWAWTSSPMTTSQSDRLMVCSRVACGRPFSGTGRWSDRRGSATGNRRRCGCSGWRSWRKPTVTAVPCSKMSTVQPSGARSCTLGFSRVCVNGPWKPQLPRRGMSTSALKAFTFDCATSSVIRVV